MADTPGKRVLYISLIGLAFLPLMANPYQREIGAVGALVSLLLVLLYIRSDRRRNEARSRGFPVIPKERDEHESHSPSTRL